MQKRKRQETVESMSRSSIDYIERLEALQERTPEFEDLVSAMHGSFVQYELEKGFAVGYGLLHEIDCAIQKYFATAESVFPLHSHGEYEYFIVIEGEGEVVIGDERRPFKARDCIVIEPGQPHLWRYSTPVKMIAITVPASKGFPGDKG